MKKTAIIFGSTTGNAETVAEKIAEKLINNDVTLIEVSKLKSTDFDDYQNLILGTSTWGLGDLQDDWDGKLSVLENSNLNGKTIAFFGTGDSSSYPDTFVDGMGILYETVSGKGANLVGQFPADGYSYDASRAEIDGHFAGVAIDEDNESNLTDERLDQWIASFKSILND
ncbi:flavodoxin [Bacteroidales bacterium OttesenSCG-928-B11]|nr:flavodoxin [Bacteroidales bacterium OttesenSCG-928-C03]MDL2312744.1 flavodoxin [Bacteroidales bacterium OttesenSCG-928-B11]